MKIFRVLIMTASLLMSALVFAQEPVSETAAEQRAREVGQALRCVVCQNQSIDESDAPLAADMRRLVRDRIRAGDSNAEIIDYMQERYGDYVLLKPPVQGNTYILWFAPFLVVAGLFLWFLLATRRRQNTYAAPATPLTPEEEERLRNLTDLSLDKSDEAAP